MKMTAHADKRSQQRGIPPFVVDLLLQFGVREHDGRGAEVCYLDRRAKRRVETYVGGLIGKLSEQLDAYVVISDDQIVTIGKRVKRINHV